jgi:cytoskeleton protein RodZ
MSEAEQVAEQPSPGRALAAARAARNLSVADVSQQIKYGARQIEAMEADDFSRLPGTTFVRGMIRSYAKLVMIDPQPLLLALERRGIPAPITVDLRTSKQEPFPDGTRKSNRVYAFLSLAVLLAVAVVAYEWHAGPPSPGEAVTITSRAARVEIAPPAPEAAAVPERAGATAEALPQPAQARSPQGAPAAGARNRDKLQRIQLEFVKESWVEIRQADGKAILSQLNSGGTQQVVEGTPPFDVVIGNASGVRLRYKDAPVDLRPYFKVDVARLTLE